MVIQTKVLCELPGRLIAGKGMHPLLLPLSLLLDSSSDVICWSSDSLLGSGGGLEDISGWGIKKIGRAKATMATESLTQLICTLGQEILEYKQKSYL